MKLFVTTHYPEHDGTHMLNWIRASAAADVHKKHQLWDDPETADAILFFEGHAGIDPLRLGVLFNPIYRKYKEKCFLYHDGDYAYPFMRGLYPSLLKEHHRPGWCEGAPYFARQAINEAVTAAVDSNPKRKWLASFVGANNCAVRANILTWKHPKIFVRDTTGQHAWEKTGEDRKQYEASYAQVCAESHAILAPRGVGPSTYRLYEAMEIGRCPIILSDNWTPPPDITWSSCSIQLHTRKIDCTQMAHILENHNLEETSACAKYMFKKTLATTTAWHYLAEAIHKLKKSDQSDKPHSSVPSCLISTHRRILFSAMYRSFKKSRRLFS